MRTVFNGVLRLHRWIGLCGWLLLMLLLVLTLAPWLAPHDPYEVNMSARLQSSSAEHWLGTDGLGRDLLSRLLLGGRNTLGISFVVLAFSLGIGIVVGLLTGFAGGWLDRVFMRVADAFMSFPDFLVALVLSGLLGPHIVNLMLALAAVKWIAYARIVRNIVRDEKAKDYIAVARLNGLGPSRLLVKHLLPHALRQVLVLASLDVGKVALLIASLSYIGLGMQPPEPEWGAMLNEGSIYFRQSAYLMLWPGFAIMLSVALASLTGERMRARLGVQPLQQQQQQGSGRRRLQKQKRRRAFSRRIEENVSDTQEKSEHLLILNNVVIVADREPLVRNVNLVLDRGNCLALIGESGSGKSLTGLSIAGLLPRGVELQPSSRIMLAGREMQRCSSKALQQIRGRQVAYVFQNYGGMFSPLLPLGKQLDETVQTHLSLSRQERQRCIIEVLEQVGLPAGRVQESYPFQLSGGQLQRVAIAAVLLLKPQLIVADEPTTALDEAAGSGVLELLHSLKGQCGCAILLITHDMSVARKYADQIAVMRGGEVVESGAAADVLEQPTHEYTRRLLAAEKLLRPDPDPDSGSGTLAVSPVTVGAASTVAPVQLAAPLQAKTAIASAVAASAAIAEAAGAEPLLSVRSLSLAYTPALSVLHNLSLDIRAGECVGLLGKSGSGKSTLARCILLLEQADAGSIFFRDQPLYARGLHGQIQAVFQNPSFSLNPRLRIVDSLMEPLDVLVLAKEAAERLRYRRSRAEKAVQLLEQVGLSGELLQRYPEQLSGGQKQRVAIARAVSVEPAFIVFDEPTAGLDMLAQAHIVALLKRLQHQFGFGALFISHDQTAIRYMSDRVFVLQNGQLSPSFPNGCAQR